MAVCRQYRIPYGHFLGGPNIWTDLDRQMALEYEILVRVKCECGTYAHEWEEDPHAYIAHSWRCPGCEIIAQEQENIPEGEKGVHVGLLPADVAEELDRAEREARRKKG
jgi:hypothetical protein